MEEEQDIYSDIVKRDQLLDAQENQEFDRDVEAYRRGQKNLTDEERLERMKDITAKRKQLKDNLLSAITVATNFATDTIEDAKVFKPWYDVPSNIGALGLRAINTAIPKTPQELQAELVELKSAGAAYPALKLAKEIPIVKKGLGKLDEATINLRKNLLASIRGDQILPDGTIVKKGSQPLMSKSLSQRMETGYKENIDRIPKRSRATDSEFTLSKIDEAAKVTKPKIKKLVDQFGGTADDVDAIFQEQVVKMQSQLKAKAWLNKYFKELTAGLGPDGLKNAKIKAVDGKPRLVDGRTKKTIDHAFEVDHQKAKELMNELGLEGADMHENLEIVYSVFNRAKNNIGNPALPDKLLKAVGQSTTLKDFVQRKLDKAFDLNYQRVPQRFRDVAKVNLMDDILDAKPGVKLEVTIEKRLKFYDKFSNLLVQIDDYVPPKVQRQLDTVYRDLNPQEYLQQLKDLGVYDRLTGKLKHLHEKLSDDWINLKRGLRSRPTTKYMQEGHDV